MSVVINSINVVNGMEVKFNTANRTDKQTYRGKIVGIVGFDVACIHEDVISVHNNMVPYVASEQIVSQQFILLKTADGAIRPFATIWINGSSFDRTDTSTDYRMVVYGVSELEIAKIMTLIRDLGFECEKI